ncbi:MAG: AraC family transcriptional regulator [Pseudomonadota bacterium]
MTTRHHPRLLLILLSTVLWLPIAGYTEDQVALQESIQDIKQQALELNRDLFILEEELLFPDNTQLAIYVSMDADELFTLDAVKLSIDGVVVTNYLYTKRQVDALQRGGVQRLYMGNMKAGEHEIVAVFTGRGPQGRDFRRATQLVVEKANGAKNLEVKILGSQAMQQPEFSVKEW